MLKKTADYKLDKYSVNNKILFNEVHKFLEEGITEGGVLWSNDIHRMSFVEILEDMLEELADDERIDQKNVICDLRNNSIADMEKGKYVLEVSYRQKNCLNTTRLVYTIQDLTTKTGLKDSLDFTLYSP